MPIKLTYEGWNLVIIELQRKRDEHKYRTPAWSYYNNLMKRLQEVWTGSEEIDQTT